MTEIKEVPPEAKKSKKETDFSTYVQVSQTFWRSQKKAPFETLSQSWELSPKNAQYLFELVLHNLPDYIDKSLKQDIKDSHPTPIIGFSVLKDERAIRREDKGPYISYLEIPEIPDIDSEDGVIAYIKGVEVINEIATDTLALEIMQNIPKNEFDTLNQMFAEIAMNLPRGKDKLIGLPKAEKEIMDIVGESSYEEFKQNLVISMLTGDKSTINQFLEKKELDDLDTIALSLGKNHGYDKRSPAYPSNLTNRLIRRLLPPVGTTDMGYPGIINIGLMHAILYPHKAPRVVIHELCHYMGDGQNHFGLIKGEYKPNK